MNRRMPVTRLTKVSTKGVDVGSVRALGEGEVAGLVAACVGDGMGKCSSEVLHMSIGELSCFTTVESFG